MVATNKEARQYIYECTRQHEEVHEMSEGMCMDQEKNEVEDGIWGARNSVQHAAGEKAAYDKSIECLKQKRKLC